MLELNRNIFGVVSIVYVDQIKLFVKICVYSVTSVISAQQLEI